LASVLCCTISPYIYDKIVILSLDEIILITPLV